MNFLWVCLTFFAFSSSLSKNFTGLPIQDVLYPHLEKLWNVLQAFQLNEYKQFAIKWTFTLVGFGWNIVECILFYKEEENNEECLSSTFIFSISSLSLLFVYLFISTCHICCTDIFLNIIVHKALLLIYHMLDTLVDIAMLTATCKCTKVEPGLNSSYIIVIYSFIDVIQSGIHFVIMVFVLCFLLFKCTRPIKIYSDQG